MAIKLDMPQAGTQSQAESRRQLPPRDDKPINWSDIVSYIILTFAALLVVMPLLWMFSHRCAPPLKVTNCHRHGCRLDFRVENYAAPFASNVPFGIFFYNSMKITLLTTLGQLVTCSLGGYAFARLRFPGREVLFIILLASLMVPIQVTIIPIFLTMRSFGLIDTHAAVILPGLISAFGVFLMRQFFKQMPQELFDAARVDGAGHVRTFLQIALPLAGPGLATLGIITFNAVWNSYFLPLIFLNSWDNMTLPQGIALLTGYMGSGNPAVVMAAVTMAILPVLIVFIVAQRWIIEALTRSGLKADLSTHKSGKIMSSLNYQLPVLKHYDQQHLRRIALPLGGIGTGTVSLGGRGNLLDWKLSIVLQRAFNSGTVSLQFTRDRAIRPSLVLLRGLSPKRITRGRVARQFLIMACRVFGTVSSRRHIHLDR